MQSSVWLQFCFIFSTVWGLGGTLTAEGRDLFDAFIRSMLSGSNKEYPKPKGFKLNKNQLFPEKGTIFDYICDKRTNMWLFWIDTLDREYSKIPPNAKVPMPRCLSLKQNLRIWFKIIIGFLNCSWQVSELIIPTDETARQMFFLRTYLNNGFPVLFVGPTGTGKSAITLNYLMSMPKDKFIPNVINFSARTTANQTQDIIMSKVDRRKKGFFGPPVGKKGVVFVDDLSIPQKEIYGAQPPIELLRQWIDHGHWYDKKDTTTINLIDLASLLPSYSQYSSIQVQSAVNYRFRFPFAAFGECHGSSWWWE